MESIPTAYNQATLDDDGDIDVPSGAIVRSWSASAAKEGEGPATVNILSPVFGALPTIAIPLGKNFGDTPPSLLGPVKFSFGGIDAAWVSWEEYR